MDDKYTPLTITHDLFLIKYKQVCYRFLLQL